MKQINCLNLCDLIKRFEQKYDTLEEVINEAKKEAGYEECHRIYVGSYFCGNYFLSLEEELMTSLVMVCKKKGINVTLVIPTFSQNDLKRGKHKIEQFSVWFGDGIDEVTVNDFGMLHYMNEQYKLDLLIGRALFKDSRDPRYEEFFNASFEPKLFNDYFLDLIKAYRVKGMEFDLSHKALDFVHATKGFIIAIHRPYSYMTFGRICEYASIDSHMEKKFRPNQKCKTQCNSHMIRYEICNDRDWIRVGRTIYYSNDDCKLMNLMEFRELYFPVRMELEVAK